MSPILSIEEASHALQEGEIVGVPTETVYGLAANALNETAVKKVFEAKKRPLTHPLICHFPDKDSVARFASFRSPIEEQLSLLWPGALTLLLSHHSKISSIVHAGLPKASFRVPDHPIMLELLRRCNFPLAAPSANLSGCLSPTTASMVIEQLGSRIAGVIDGGACQVGLESTIVNVNENEEIEILRHGGISIEEIERKIEKKISKRPIKEMYATVGRKKRPISSGLQSRHYCPSSPLIVFLSETLPEGWEDTREVQETLQHYNVPVKQCCFLSFGDEYLPIGWGKIAFLSKKKDLQEASRRLFSCLSECCKEGFRLIFAHLLPAEGLGNAMNDRLYRASSHRFLLPS